MTQYFEPQPVVLVDTNGNPYKASGGLGTRLRDAAAAAFVRNSVDLGPISSGGPTVTTGASNDAALVLSLGPFSDGAVASYRFRGGSQSYPAGWFGLYSRIGAVTTVSAGNVDNNRNNTGSAVEFYTDAPKFSLQVSGGSGGFMLEIDGQATTAAATAMASNPGYIVVDFAGVRKARHIRFETSSADFAFGGVWTTFSDSVWAPPAGLRLAAVGDSTIAGTGSSLPNGGYAKVLGKLLGISDVWGIGIGGTGFTVANGENTIGSAQRVADTVTANPDVLLIPASQNDGTTGLTAAALAAFRAYRTALPTAPIICGGVHPGTTGPSAAVLAIEDAVKAAFDQWADPNSFWVPVSRAADSGRAKPWILGTGMSGAPNGSGNADIYEGGTSGTDTAHPNQAGHVYYARRWANAIRNTVLPAL